MEAELKNLYESVKKLRDSIEHKNTGTVSQCSTILVKINAMQLKFCKKVKSIKLKLKPQPQHYEVKEIGPHNAYMLKRTDVPLDQLKDESLYMVFKKPLQQCQGEFCLPGMVVRQDEWLVEPLKEGMVKTGRDFKNG